MGVTLKESKLAGPIRGVCSLILIFLLSACGSPLLNSSKKDPVGEEKSPREMTKTQTSEKQKFKATVVWSEGPHTDPKFENRLIIIVTDERGQRMDVLSPNSLFFYAWMPSMGHGSADDGFIERVGEGVYEVKEFYLPHGGQWNLFVQILEEKTSRTKFRFL